MNLKFRVEKVFSRAREFFSRLCLDRDSLTSLLVSDDKHIREMLNRYFSSVFTTENQCAMPDVKNIYHCESPERLFSIDITSDMVTNKLSKLKMNKAPGVNLVGTRM